VVFVNERLTLLVLTFGGCHDERVSDVSMRAIRWIQADVYPLKTIAVFCGMVLSACVFAEHLRLGFEGRVFLTGRHGAPAP
jgi:hypothetical protein